jgi:hypothetical protein
MDGWHMMINDSGKEGTSEGLAVSVAISRGFGQVTGAAHLLITLNNPQWLDTRYSYSCICQSQGQVNGLGHLGHRREARKRTLRRTVVAAQHAQFSSSLGSARPSIALPLGPLAACCMHACSADMAPGGPGRTREEKRGSVAWSQWPGKPGQCTVARPEGTDARATGQRHGLGVHRASRRGKVPG